MTRAVIYTRISVDPDGVSESPDNQANACRSYVQGQKWTVVKVLTDRNITAAESKRARPEYEEALRMLEADEADVLVAHKLDRLQRSSLQWNLLNKRVWDCGKRMVIADGTYDTDDPHTILMGQILIGVAEQEVRNTKARSKVATAARAKDGRPHPGGHRTFGYTKWKKGEGMKVIPSEAEEIQRMARAVIEGASLKSLATDLNERGIQTTATKPWSVTSLGRMLQSAVITGQRTHLGERHGTTHWEAIISPTTSAEVTRAITANKQGRETQARYLLSTTLRCGVCGGPMQGGKLPNGGHAYRCFKEPGTDRCGSNGIAGPPTDELVVRLMFERMKSATPAQGRSKDDLVPLRQELANELAALQRFHRDRHDPAMMIAPETAGQIIGDYAERIRKLEMDIAQIESETVAIDVAGDVATWWEGATLTQKRDLIRRQFRTLKVAKAIHRGNRYRPERLLGTLEFA